jgi:hypothetical protein
MDTYHTGKRPMNSGYVSYREEANAFWLDMIKGFGNEASEIKIVFM